MSSVTLGILLFVSLAAGAAVAIAQGGNSPIVFSFTSPPSGPPTIPAPGAAPNCVIAPEKVTVATAKLKLPFQLYELPAVSPATLRESMYAKGCDGALGLDLHYDLGGLSFEIVESKSTAAPNSPLSIRLKGNGSITAAQIGWSTIEIAGEPFAVLTTSGGKGSEPGILEAIWQSGATLLTLTARPISGAATGAPTPLPIATFEDIVGSLVAA